MKHILLSAFMLTAWYAGWSQNITVKDISEGQPSSNPNRITAFGNKLVFFANDMDDAYGNELLAMDSAGNIELVYDINPGAASSATGASYYSLPQLGGKIYFAANNGTNGTELYSWDGANPPELVTDLVPGSGSSSPGEMVAYNNKLYFSAFVTAVGTEVFVHDPANNTTKALADINPGTGSSIPQGFTVYNGKLYFAAQNSAAGRELFMFDAAADSVRLVKDINPGTAASDPQTLVTGNGMLFFSAIESTTGRELYAMFDTTITRLTDLNPGAGGSFISTLTSQNRIGVLNGKVYFCGSDGVTSFQLYKYDLKTKTTSLVYKINPAAGSAPGSFTRYNNKLYFSATDGVNGTELWAYDGMTAPQMVADINFGTGASSNPVNLAVWGGKLYFNANDLDHGLELYEYSDNSLSIKKAGLDADFNVYPNPARSEINIGLRLAETETLAVSITDAGGREVFNTTAKTYNAGNHVITIPVQGWAGGIYFYTVTNGNGSAYAKGRLLKQ